MTALSWKRRGVWYSGVADVAPPPTTPAPTPTPTAPPIIDYLQVFYVREDAAIGTEIGPVLASRSPTSWTIESGNTGTTWQITSAGKLKLLKALSATTNGSYVLYVKAYNPLPSEAQFVVVNVTAVAAPPPGTTGGVPNAILNMTAAAAANLFTTGISTQETWPAGEWPSAVRSGPIIGENNTWAVRPGWWDYTFIANGALPVGPGQFHSRVGVGPATSQDGTTFEIHAKVPGGAKPSGAPSEVIIYPAVGHGQLMGWYHRQIRQPANVPRQMQAINALWVGAKSINYSGTTCVGHFCHDARIGNTSANSSTNSEAVAQTTMEFMIVHKAFGGYGVGPGARPSGSHRGTLTIGGIEYYIHTQQGATPYPEGGFATLLCFVPTAGYLPADMNDFSHVIRFCCETRWNQLPNGPGSRFERGRNSGDFMIQPTSWLKHDFWGFEVDGTHAGEVHIVANTGFYRMALD